MPAMNGEGHKQALPPDSRLGSYRVVRVLGVGGFGITYLCEHTGLGVRVAVKEYLPNELAVRDGASVHPKSAADREGFEWGLSRFLEEARTLARFKHRNVVRVRDCFKANSTAYIVMDYEEGESLDRLLQRLKTLTEAQLKRVLLPVADGLRQVHAAGFLHRDIKPSNIFVRRSDESPVLLDFGSARQALGRKSRSMTAIASAGYSPPEQYESDGEQGPWTDIYALSALCYRAITGKMPMEAPRRQSRLLRSQKDPLPSLAKTADGGYSLAFLEAVDWGLRVIETERPQNLDEWLVPLNGSAAAGAPAAIAATATKTAPDERTTASSSKVPLQLEAEQGVAIAQFNLGVMYYLGFPKDVGQAALWFRKAAEQGVAGAQFNLGVMYAQGEGVPENEGKAAFWFRKAAEQGVASAQFNLGVMYQGSKGVPEDYVQAYAWLNLAAAQGNENAEQNRAALRQEMTPAQIADAQKLSRELAD